MTDQRFENPRTGEIVEVVGQTDDVLTMRVTWPRAGRRAPAHEHPTMQETWHVVDGRAAFRIGGVDSELGPGESVTAEAGTPHLAWNPTDAPVVLRIEMRPPARWAEFVRRLFAGDPPGELLASFADEIRLV